jgi:hypothetical protein
MDDKKINETNPSNNEEIIFSDLLKTTFTELQKKFKEIDETPVISGGDFEKYEEKYEEEEKDIETGEIIPIILETDDVMKNIVNYIEGLDQEKLRDGMIDYELQIENEAIIRSRIPDLALMTYKLKKGIFNFFVWNTVWSAFTASLCFMFSGKMGFIHLIVFQTSMWFCVYTVVYLNQVELLKKPPYIHYTPYMRTL